MKAEVDLRTMKAAFDGTPEEVAAACLRLGQAGGKSSSSSIDNKPTTSGKFEPKPFTLVEDTQILQLKKDGLGWRTIGAKLNRSSDSIRGRYERLRLKTKAAQEITEQSPSKPAPEPEKAPHKPGKKHPWRRDYTKSNPGRPGYSDEDNNTIITMFNGGETDEAIATKLGRSVKAIGVHMVHLRKAGFIGKRTGKGSGKRGRKPGQKNKPKARVHSNVTFSDEEINQIKELHKNGETPLKIAQLIGRSSIEVMAAMQNLGLTV